MSLKRRKTLPLRSFSLLTGSNDRLARISSFCNCCHYRHHCLCSVFLFKVQTSSSETLGCSSGRSESRRNQRRHLWFLRSDNTPTEIKSKRSESIPDQGDNRSCVEDNLKQVSLRIKDSVFQLGVVFSFLYSGAKKRCHGFTSHG